jgi:flagellar assembly factor FliW
MRVSTANFGELDIETEDIFTFPQGIPGFEDLRRFVIIQPDPQMPFSYLQSVEQGELSIIMTNPFLFYPDYELQLSDQTQEELGIEQEKDVLVWSTVSIKDQIKDATTNLLAPIIVNVKKKCGKQVILHGTDYITKHRLMQKETRKNEG